MNEDLSKKQINHFNLHMEVYIMLKSLIVPSFDWQ